MIVGFSTKAWEDYKYWLQNDKQIVKRINLLIEDIKRNPNDSNGIGKPERLRKIIVDIFQEELQVSIDWFTK